MPTKPTDSPSWASLAAALRTVEPTTPLKEQGYDPGARPAAQHLNWQLRALERWRAYLEAETDYIHASLFTTETTRKAYAIPGVDFHVSGAGAALANIGSGFEGWFIPDNCTGQGAVPVPERATITSLRIRGQQSAAYAGLGPLIRVGRIVAGDYSAGMANWLTTTRDSTGGGADGAYIYWHPNAYLSPGWDTVPIGASITIGAGERALIFIDSTTLTAGGVYLESIEFTYSWSPFPAPP